MENQITIQNIAIKNFRSLRRVNIKVDTFNVFVGMNDAGKSNILKSLNLFFNDKVDGDGPFNYDRDFSYLFPAKSKEAKKITISIQFFIPESFRDGGVYVWKKEWNKDGKITDEILNSDGTPPASRSRISSALKRIKYRYVPAVKSPDYYKALLANMYASVSASLNSDLSEAVDTFSYALESYTEAITLDVSKRLKLSSQLTIPTDLQEIFKALIFRTNRNLDSITVPLTARGDGIQARHIPIILKYIAMEDQKSRNQGSTKVTTIWGFEDPENGLELSNAFALADEFVEYAQDLQIFVTTHSPAFYMKKAESGVKIFYVEKITEKSDETNIVAEKSSTKIADAMGLMPLVAPFIAEQAKKLEKAQEIYNKNVLTDTPTIMVEGETDVDYLTLAIRHLSPSLQQLLDDQKLRIIYKLDGAGTTQLCDWALAWIYSGFRSKLYLLLDKDAAGIEARDEIINGEAYKSRQNSLTMRIAHIQPSEDIIQLHKDGIHKMPFEIEHLCSTEVWEKWKECGLVALRSDQEMQKMFSGLVPRNKTLDSVIEDLVKDVAIRETILMFEPGDLKKKRMVSCLKENFKEKADTFWGFARTISDIETFFCK